MKSPPANEDLFASLGFLLLVAGISFALLQGFYFGISTTAGGGVLGRLRSSTPSPSPSPTRRSRVGLGLGRGVLELKLHEVPTTDSSQVR